MNAFAAEAQIGSHTEVCPIDFDTCIRLLDITVKILTFFVLFVTAVLAVRRFGLQRETATFLRVTVSAEDLVVSRDLVLVALTVRLDNLGQTKIDARRTPRDANGFLYDDGWDRLRHAGTLQVRSIPKADHPLLFDWYTLSPLSLDTSLSSDSAAFGDIVHRVRELEQINYLDDYQDPEGSFAEAHFWLEPRESYELFVPLWLPHGTYAAKAVFLGKDRSHSNEEYWSHALGFEVGATSSGSRAAMNGRGDR